MQNSDARVVRSLSIAVVVISVLGIIGALFGLLITFAGVAALTDPNIMSELSHSLNSDPNFSREIDGYYLDDDAILGLGGLTMFAIGAFCVWVLICSLVGLIAGIIGIRNCAKPEKLGSAFGWAVAGAIASFLTGNLVTMVLLIVSAVYINRIRRPKIPYGQQPAYYGTPYGQPTQPGQQPYYGQPQVDPYAQQAPYAGQPAAAPVAQPAPNAEQQPSQEEPPAVPPKPSN